MNLFNFKANSMGLTVTVLSMKRGKRERGGDDAELMNSYQQVSGNIIQSQFAPPPHTHAPAYYIGAFRSGCKIGVSNDKERALHTRAAPISGQRSGTISCSP